MEEFIGSGKGRINNLSVAKLDAAPKESVC